VPKKQRAIDAINANPRKSDNAIAADLGISNAAVSKARNSGVTQVTPREVTGRDGKIYRLPLTHITPRSTPGGILWGNI
jgi:hypothetical protein